MNLRDYQTEAADAFFGYFERGGTGNPVIVAPTGSGKSLILAEIARRVAELYGGRTLVLAHVKELLQQNADKLARLWPEGDIGVHSAGLNSRDTDSDVLLAGIQSVHRIAKRLSNHHRPIEIVIVDECHRVSVKDVGTYRSFISDLKGIFPDLKVLGLTATPFRHVPGTKEKSGGYDLVVGGESLFDEIVHEIGLMPLIERGYLAPLWPAKTGYTVDLKELHERNGDYREDEMGALMAREEVVDAILDEAVPAARADGRRHWLVFCAGVAQAEAMTDGLRARGVEAGLVVGGTPSHARAALIDAFRAGDLTALVSVGVLTTGFDAPNTDCLIVARPTLSPVLYCQIMGRGMRPTAEKLADHRGCLVLDYVGNVSRHGPIDRLRLKKPDWKKPQPTKTCPQCEAEVPIQASVCECGYEFPPAEKEKVPIGLNGKPIIAALSRSGSRVKVVPVNGTRFTFHLGKSGIPTLQMDYYAGLLKVASEWVCFEHPIGSLPRRKAEKWFLERTDADCIPPTSIGELFLWMKMGLTLRRVTNVHVLYRPGAKYSELVRCELAPITQGEAV